MMDRLERLSKLLSTYNPFGVVEKGEYVSYSTTLDAYVDIMVRVQTMCPRGYIDIPMVFSVIMGLPMVKAIKLCKRRDYEITFINVNDPPAENIDKWRQLLKVLLRNTGVAFREEVFYAAWPEFWHLMLKQDATNEQVKQKQESYYDEDSFNTEGDTE